MSVQRQHTPPVVPAQAVKAAAAHTGPSVTPRELSAEKLETPNLDTLRAALAAEPELRPSQVAQAIVWAKDPDYPPLDALNNIAGTFLADAIRNL